MQVLVDKPFWGEDDVSIVGAIKETVALPHKS
jgi:hypothetical protein